MALSALHPAVILVSCLSQGDRAAEMTGRMLQLIHGMPAFSTLALCERLTAGGDFIGGRSDWQTINVTVRD